MSDRILLDKDVTTQDQATAQDRVEPNKDKGYNLATVGIGAVFGALMGAAAAAFASKITIESVNNTVKGVGDAVKGAAEGVSTTVKGVGDAVKNVAENVDYTLKDVGTTVKGSAEEVNENLKGTVDVVKNTAQSVNYTVKETKDVIKSASESVSQNVKNTVDAASQSVLETENKPAEGTQKQNEAQTAYILVPVDKDKYMIQNPTDSGMPTNSP
jgi:gas vesicle protein